ncbi:hypothetical protein [Nonomuraea sp. NPDC005650]|uniref:hypothetical protein n=1 Tax=Nonomuraea sp. NPDC005650 TaxID=3157045 RepID=UPI0033AC756F
MSRSRKASQRLRRSWDRRELAHPASAVSFRQPRPQIRWADDGPGVRQSQSRHGARICHGLALVEVFGENLVGRQVSTGAPQPALFKPMDGVESQIAYDDLDRKVTSTDARGKTIWTGYHGLSRVTETRDGSATGTELTSFVYDTLRKGSLTSAIRYVGGQSYVNRVDSYDPLGRATRTSVVVPATEIGLEGTYTFNTNGTLQSLAYPAASGLAAEAVTHGYDELLRRTTMGSNLSTYVTGTTYTHTGKVEQYEVGSVADKNAWFTYTYQYGTQRLASSRVDRQSQTGIARDASYIYAQAGNIASIADVSVNGADTQCFTYDALDVVEDSAQPARRRQIRRPQTFDAQVLRGHSMHDIKAAIPSTWTSKTRRNGLC